MTILTIQKRLHERGRIRIGQKVPTSGGRERPEKLDRFRFTSADRSAMDDLARQHGGIVEAWASPNGPQWELVSDSTDLPVVVPPSEFGFSQFLELWSGGGCQRRCDGEQELISGGHCICAINDEQLCKPTTRLSVILPDLPGLGLWRLETHGWNAAAELQGTVELIAAAMGHGRLLPARLRLQQRSSIVTVSGKSQTVRFAVPVLDLDVRMGELASAGVPVAALHGETPALAALSAPAVEVEADRPRITPVPVQDMPEAPVPSIRDQVTAEPRPRAKRSNAQTPLPATGLKPRTAASAGEWMQRINAIADPKEKRSCMDSFRDAFGNPPFADADPEVANRILAAFEPTADDAPPDDSGELETRRKALHAAAGQAFPCDDAPRGDKSRQRELLRRAAQYVVVGEHVSSNDLTVVQLRQVEQFIRSVYDESFSVHPTLTIGEGDVVAVSFNGSTVEVPPAAATTAA